LYSNVSERMDYIQKLFLNVGTHLQKKTSLDEVIAFLETESPEYRSVAYESASYEIALEELKSQQQLNRWKQFRELCARQHTFHMDIGLGWAFAKTGLNPESYLLNLQPLVKLMVYDGLGYYYGLFKGRSTLKNKELPEIEYDGTHGFNQGLGRRLWYMAKGNVNAVNELLVKFPASRHPHLFRGIGIACGYVGGNEKQDLENLLEVSAENKPQLQLGVALAAISRIASETISENTNMACCLICNKTIDELKISITKIRTNLFYLYNDSPINHDWLTQLESELLQTNNATPSL
jgi:enediyne biosynthesis protein E3